MILLCSRVQKKHPSDSQTPLTEITGLGLVEECSSSYQTYVLIVPVKQDKCTHKHTKTNNSMFRILFVVHIDCNYTHTEISTCQEAEPP